MSREGSASPEGLPQDWPRSNTASGRLTSFRIKLQIFRTNSRCLLLIFVLTLLTLVCLFEARISELQARILSAFATQLSYNVGPGPSPRIVFPSSGPFNEVRGYVGLPAFVHRLTDAGFHVVAQSRLSSELERLARWRITPPFDEPALAGLVVRGDNRAILYNAASRQRVFKSYDEIPPLVIQALLFVENRELDDSDIATRNPVVDWNRLGKAGLMYVGHKIGLPLPVEGGSTLATQIENSGMPMAAERTPHRTSSGR